MAFVKCGVATGRIEATGSIRPVEGLEKQADTMPQDIRSQVDWKENANKDAAKQ